MVGRYFFVFLLISLVGFLILPKIILADEFDDINPAEIAKYLELPGSAVENLINSLIKVFHNEWENLMTSRWFSPPYPTAEEMAVPSIMKKVVQVQALNHLLVDAPIEITWKIINNSVKIARLLGAQDVSAILDELERESVKKAVNYGISILFGNEIRATPGAIGFEYITRKGEIKEVIFQYIIVYKPTDNKNGEVSIRFYSSNLLEPPKNQGSYGAKIGMYTELTRDLPPFIVDIQGAVEDYKWVGSPSMKIDFPPEVPDLGIKPLSFWEKYVLKPIQSKIKEVEILITKIAGGSSNIAETIWDWAKSKIQDLAQWGGAQIGLLFGNQPSSEPEQTEPEPLPPQAPEPEIEPEPEQEPEFQPKQLTLEDLQEILDDIAERIDVLNQQVSELTGVQERQAATEEIAEKAKEDEKKEEKVGDLAKKEVSVCRVNINTAAKEDLEKITEVGPVIAQKIIEARPFSSINDLTRVSGIGEITLQKIIGQGCTYVDSTFAFAGSGTGTGAASASGSSQGGSEEQGEQEEEEEEQSGVSPLAVVINEIAWMGTATSSSDEWIELYNNTAPSIDLAGWTLKAVDDTPSITFSTGTTTIPGFSFYLLERTGDNTILDIAADKIYTGALNNNPNCEVLTLYDQNNNEIDKTVCFENGNWPAGDNSTKQTMERINPGISGSDAQNWANNNQQTKNGLDAGSNPIQGTPKAQNSVYQSLSPEAITDLTIDSPNGSDDEAELTWSAPNDPDTLSENLSYEIYYLKEDLNEDNLEQALVASSTAATTSIANLDFNSTYYFGVKAFDGQNYSVLSNIVSQQIISALVNSSWIVFKKDLQRSGQADFAGPQTTPSVAWVYDKEANSNNPDNNPLYTSPVVRSDGAVLSAIIYPSSQKGVLVLSSQGNKKWFREAEIDSPSALQAEGSVLADEISRAWSEGQTSYYYGQGDILYGFNEGGGEKWQKQFEFIEPEADSCASTTPSVVAPAVGSDGLIYAVVQNNSCSADYKLDYVYALSAESGDVAWQAELLGYNSSLPVVSSDGIVYIFTLTFPKYASGPTLWLKAVANGQVQWEKSFDNNFQSLPVVDSQGNIYFSIGKRVYGFNKEGDEIWQVYLNDAPSNWATVSDFASGLALPADGVLYASGRGAIFAIK